MPAARTSCGPAIKGLVQLLKRGASDEKSRERLSVICSEVTRMEGILRDYLSFSRPLEDLKPQPVELGELPIGVQAKLLRAIQEGEIQPVGSGRVDEVDVRVVVAGQRASAREHRRAPRGDELDPADRGRCAGLR